MGKVRKFLANKPLKDVTMERVRVEQSYFSLGFLFQIISGSSQYFVGIKGIYTRVRKECEESVFP